MRFILIITAIIIAVFFTSKTVSNDKQEELSITAPVKIERVIDGDTVEVSFTAKIPVRFLDCWAEPLKTKGGDDAAQYLKGIAEGKSAILKIPIKEKFSDHLTFGRILGTITLQGDVKSLNEIMVEQGKAKATKK